MGKGCTAYLFAAMSAVTGAQYARSRFHRFQFEEAAGDCNSLFVGLQKCSAIGALVEVVFERREVSGAEIRDEIASDQGSFFLAGQRPSWTFACLVLVRRSNPSFTRRGATALHRLILVGSSSNCKSPLIFDMPEAAALGAYRARDFNFSLAATRRTGANE